MNTPREYFGQLNSLFRSKHGVVYTYELVIKRYRVGRGTKGGKGEGGRGDGGGKVEGAWESSDMKSPIQ